MKGARVKGKEIERESGMQENRRTVAALQVGVILNL